MSRQKDQELDQLLSEIRQLLDQDAQPAAEPVSEETRIFQPIPTAAAQAAQASQPLPWEAPGYTGSYYGPDGGQVVRSAAARHQPAAASVPRPTKPASWEEAPQDSSRAARAAQSRRQERRERRRFERQADREDEAYWDEEAEPAPPKKRHRLRKFLLFLLLLFAAAAALVILTAKQPMANDDSMGARKPGVSTVLLIGTDRSGDRTDTLLLLSLDRPNRTASLVSIPRDTLVNGSYSVPKINGVYGINGGGEEGIEMLLQRTRESIGFQPDGYLLVDLDSFVSLVDTMGGVTFNVPQNMYYSDPTQDLYIDLSAGEQKLNGQQAMGLVRYRTGYAAADLQRVQVQRDFVSTAAHQWLKPTLVLKLPQLLAWLHTNVETDLSVRNLSWLAQALMAAGQDSITTDTLPGAAADILGGSYYVLHPYDVAALVNQRCNPYARDITVDDLYIRG